MTRLDELRAMRDFIDREIATELKLMGAPLGAESAVQRAAELYGVAPADVLSGTRTAQAVKARQGAAWLLRRAGMSLPQIGEVLGCHHTTVLHSVRLIEASTPIKTLLAGLGSVA